ncbi:Hypothetical predicted protein [Lecanosticta acicola]|uniref:Uncharacterized protein n=1 Tax=Lecanosticta acicola TaxID=111012 RepID=A0AAI9EEB2_9PEZI|nr:Hypothetical predicted protein [Lecanosticta acicola]
MTPPTIRLVEDELQDAHQEVAAQEIRQSPRASHASSEPDGDGNSASYNRANADWSNVSTQSTAPIISNSLQKRATQADAKGGEIIAEGPNSSTRHRDGQPSRDRHMPLNRHGARHAEMPALAQKFSSQQASLPPHQQSDHAGSGPGRLHNAIHSHGDSGGHHATLWQRRATRPLSPTRSQALVYMSLRDGLWPTEDSAYRELVSGPGPAPIARTADVEARRALRYSVTDSVAAEIDSDDGVNSMVSEPAKKRQRNVLRKKQSARKSSTSGELAEGDAAGTESGGKQKKWSGSKRLWNWWRGVPPEQGRSFDIAREHVDANTGDELRDWRPGASPSLPVLQNVDWSTEDAQLLPFATETPASRHTGRRYIRLGARRRRVLRSRIDCMTPISERTEGSDNDSDGEEATLAPENLEEAEEWITTSGEEGDNEDEESSSDDSDDEDPPDSVQAFRNRILHYHLMNLNLIQSRSLLPISEDDVRIEFAQVRDEIGAYSSRHLSILYQDSSIIEQEEEEQAAGNVVEEDGGDDDGFESYEEDEEESEVAEFFEARVVRIQIITLSEGKREELRRLREEASKGTPPPEKHDSVVETMQPHAIALPPSPPPHIAEWRAEQERRLRDVMEKLEELKIEEAQIRSRPEMQ